MSETANGTQAQNPGDRAGGVSKQVPDYWTCPQCNALTQEAITTCWNCNRPRPAEALPAESPQGTVGVPVPGPQAQQEQPAAGGIPGWIWFLLIYGAGNIILYNTTGALLLPIPRK